MKTNKIKHIVIAMILIISISFVNAQDCTQCDNTTPPPGNYASEIGENTTAEGDWSFSGGYSSESAGVVSFSFGANCYSAGPYSVTLGHSIKSNGLQSMVIGTGAGNEVTELLTNNISQSLMIGFGSEKPTLFVGQSAGQGTTGKIGIGDITDPQAKLHIKADSDEDADLLLEPGNSMKYARIKFGSNGNKIDARGSQDLNFHTASDFVFWDGNVGIGTNNPGARLQISNGDVFIEDINSGIIMKSPDGQCWRGTLDNSGSLNFTEIDCGSLTSTNSNDNDLKEVNIYPNPAKNSITVKVEGFDKRLNVNIYNQSGNLIISREMNSNSLKIKTGKLPAGNYIVTIVDKTGRAVKSSKITIL